MSDRDLFANFARMRREMDEMLSNSWGRAGYVTRRASGFSPNVDVYYCGEPQKAVVHARRAIRFMPIYPPWFVEILAASYRDAGMLDLSVIAAREILRVMPTTVQGRLILASAVARSDWLADARRIAREVRELDADFTLGRWVPSQPYRDANMLAGVVDDLRKAGIPG